MNVRRLPGRLARRPLPNGPDGPDGPDGPGGPGGPGGPDPTAGKGAVEGSDAYQGPDDLLPLPPESLATCSTVPTAQFRGKRSPAPRVCEPGGRQAFTLTELAAETAGIPEHAAVILADSGSTSRIRFSRPDRLLGPRSLGWAVRIEPAGRADQVVDRCDDYRDDFRPLSVGGTTVPEQSPGHLSRRATVTRSVTSSRRLANRVPFGASFMIAQAGNSCSRMARSRHPVTRPR
jgi:hypothetical protein